ncbi:hypothetical protein Pmani_017268 [Petrolisthes manimaculis]|uniref:Peptidase S1 domain-containing protein n=1 Tax=Petrolisthes manimaculis TaxID=1843537 RepID=A0AAE1PM57_9EUCA|nr:hypothetical protein Pmani_017268 [Petrolisthes manimaculis]
MWLFSRVLLACCLVLLTHLSRPVQGANDPRLRLRASCDTACRGQKCGQVNREPRVVGGSPTLPHQYPWLASLFYRGKLYCAASLVSDTFLITAAHCIKRVTMSRVEIVLGHYNKTNLREASRASRKVGAWWAHPDFDRRSYNNDIGVIKLDTPVVMNKYISPVCLPNLSATETYAGKTGIVAGWGRLEENGEPAKVLREVRVPIMTNSECKTKKYKPHEITDTMMCAGYDTGKIDACQGDSGGPLLYSNGTNIQVIGIVSWGQGCAREKYPGVYTRISAYWDFINSHIYKEGCFCPSQ